MSRGLVALFALLEALFVVAVGVAVALAVGLLGWASLAGNAITPLDVWRVSVDLWALGHGAPIHVDLADVSGIFAAPNNVFDVTLAPFGFALVTAFLGRRAGTRIAVADDAPLVAGLFIGFVAALAALTMWSASTDTVQLDVTSGTVRVTSAFVLGMIVGWRPWESPTGTPFLRLDGFARWSTVLADAGRIALGSVLALTALGSFTVAACVVAGFPTEIALYESLHSGVFGGFVVALLQLALAPVLIVWSIAWISGPGFALGAGSLVTPFASTIGAVPAIPILGALPTTVVVGVWVCLIPVIVAAIVSGRTFRISSVTPGQGTLGDDLVSATTTAVSAGALTAIGALAIGSLASGSVGPGRFVQFGIDPIAVAAFLGTEVFAGALVVALARVAVTRSR